MNAALSPGRRQTVRTRRFDGLGGSDSPGSFTEAVNMSSRLWPAAASSPPHSQICTLENGYITPFVAGAPGWLCHDGTLWYDGEQVSGWNCADTDAPMHSAAVLGSRVYFFPDKAWYDTRSGAFGMMEINKSSSSATVTVTYDDGVSPPYYTYSQVAPELPDNNDLWFKKDYSAQTFAVYRWVTALDEWVRQTVMYYRVAFSGAGSGIAAGTRISVAEAASSDTSFPGFNGNRRVVSSQSGALVLECAPEDRLLPRICRLSAHSLTLTSIALRRLVPDICLAFSNGERIWGVSNDGLHIYASAAGDPFLWDYFDGGNAGSVSINVGSPGSFTGGAVLGSTPVFFKRDRITRVVGNRPDNFALAVTESPGLAGDSPLAVVSGADALYYAATDGALYRWDGGRPERISGALSGFSRVRAGRQGDLVYFACKQGGTRQFCVWDTVRRVWYTQKGDAESFFSYGGALYYADLISGTRCLRRIGTGESWGAGAGSAATPHEWSLESSAFAPGEGSRAVPCELLLDMESDGIGAVYVDFTWDGVRRRAAELCFKGRTRRAVSLPRISAETVRFAVRGSGEFVLREAALTSLEN